MKKHIIAEKMVINIIEGRCLSYGEMITYFPLLEVLKKLFGISDPDPMDTIRQKILKDIGEVKLAALYNKKAKALDKESK